MADNMIELVARINTENSADEINKNDIPDLQKQLKKINIKCNLDVGSINELKKQFSSINSGNIKKVTNSIVKEFNESFNIIGKVSESSKKEFNAQTKQMLQEFKEAWQKGIETGDFSVYTEVLDKLENRIREFNKGDVEQLKNNIAEIRSFFTDGSKVSIGSNLKDWLDTATGSNALSREYLDAIYGHGNYTIGSGNSGYDTLFKEDKDIVESIISAAQKILEYQDKIKSTGWGFEEFDALNSDAKSYLEIQGQISKGIEDHLRKIVGLPELAKNGDLFEFDANERDEIRIIDDLAESYEEAAEQSENLHRKQELLQQSYEALSAKIAKAKLDINEIGTREEFLTGEKVNYNEQFNEIMSDEIVDPAQLSKARDLLNAINNEFKILNAQTESSIPQNALENLIQRIAKTDSQIKILTIDYEKLEEVPQELKNSFDNLQRAMENFDFSSDYRSMSKEQISETVQQYTQIRIALNDTQSLIKAEKERAKTNNKLIELKEKEVQRTKQLNELQAHDYWQGRFEEAKDALTAQNQVTKEMKKYYQDLEKEAQKTEKLKRQDEEQTARINDRVRRLAADMKSYAAANERAVNSTKLMSNGRSFRDTWGDIEKLAQKAKLTDSEVKKLATDLIVFKKEARSAGLAGQNALEKFLNSFKTMSSYITANMVFNFVKRQLRDMVNEVTEIDTAMTELRKVTEATDEDFDKFAKSAGKTAKELGSTISDVINATATFARLGESLPDAEELGRVATLYKNVGDGISEETAAEDLVSTMKAFNIEAKDSIEIVDKFNEVETCPFYILVERNRRHIFSNCWEILKSFSLLFSKRRKSETSKRITYGEKKHIQSAKVVCVLSVV